MSGKFEGFTQEDINKLSRQGKNAKVILSGRGIRRLPDTMKTTKGTKTPVQIANNKTSNSSTKSEIIEETTDESMTSLQDALHFRPLSVKSQPENNQISDESILHLSTSVNQSNEYPERKISSPFRGVSLKDFEAQRKRVEEQNKQKKELLYRAIELHSKKTAAETKKIEDIKAELAKLDHELAADVAILRKQIEAACVQYCNIQKQYDKIESQFLKAKIELHNACEKKELLTEHLCTVITHNEDRKAKKLSELMEKVGISPSDDLIIPDS